MRACIFELQNYKKYPKYSVFCIKKAYLCIKNENILKRIALILVMLMVFLTSAFSRKRQWDQDTLSVPTDSVQLLKAYVDSLQHLIDSYRSVDPNRSLGTVNLSPYFYQVISPAILYRQPLHQQLGVEWSKQDSVKPFYLFSSDYVSDTELSRLYHANQALSAIYTSNPWLVSSTEKQLEEGGKVMKDIDAPIKSDIKMQEEVKLAELEHDDVGDVQAILRRPNFWKFKGSNSLNLTQNYATDNWFQGKANYYNLQGIVAVEANFNNQRRIQLDNRLDLQLGFQTNSDNEFQKFKPTNNLVRLNSKLGVKAAKNWFYTFNVKAESQLVPNNNYNKEGVATCITDFLSPLNIDISVGIDWKWNLKRFTGSFYLAPCTYNLKYVDRLALSTRYGVDKDHHSKSTFGPSSTIRFNWKIASNINWDSRLYWITNMHYTNVEFENTITFSINKYLTSKFYFYPRFNDQSINNRMPDDEGKHTGTYWMFKEWLSLGISYSW